MIGTGIETTESSKKTAVQTNTLAKSSSKHLLTVDKNDGNNINSRNRVKSTLTSSKTQSTFLKKLNKDSTLGAGGGTTSSTQVKKTLD